MDCVQKITDNIYWIGVSDRRLSLFENVYPIPEGVSYNSYLIKDNKTALLDTVDYSGGRTFFENLDRTLDGQTLDYMIINHMEPDHCACIDKVISRYPDVKLVVNSRTIVMLEQFFDIKDADRYIIVDDNYELDLGVHKLTFFAAPMVHWPEVMVTYDKTTGTLFSADAFGSFGAINGNIFADEIYCGNEWLAENRRYYTNIVGKYGAQVIALLNKVGKLSIERICPLHGAIWRKNLNLLLNKYETWAKYQEEEKGVLIVYASIYGNTENAVNILANELAKSGVEKIAVYDVSGTHSSYLIAEAFRYSHIVLASITYNGDLFVNMDNFINDLIAHNIQNKHISLIENGSWAPVSVRKFKEKLAKCKGVIFNEKSVTIRSAVNKESLKQLEELSITISESIK